MIYSPIVTHPHPVLPSDKPSLVTKPHATVTSQRYQTPAPFLTQKTSESRVPRLMGTSNEETGDCAKKKRKKKRPRKALGDGGNGSTTCDKREEPRKDGARFPSPVSFAPDTRKPEKQT